MLTVIVRHQDSIDDESSHVAYEAIADALTKYVGSGREKKMVSDIALHYYKLAFARADNNGEPVTVLGPLNYSIAETHRKDLGDYESALDSFKRQLEYEVRASGKTLRNQYYIHYFLVLKCSYFYSKKLL